MYIHCILVHAFIAFFLCLIFCRQTPIGMIEFLSFYIISTLLLFLQFIIQKLIALHCIALHRSSVDTMA